MTVIHFTVPGRQQPAGSKRAMVPLDAAGQPYRNKKTGRVIANVIDANPAAKGWKQQVAFEARQAWYRPPLQQPVLLQIVFYVQRPKKDYVAGDRDRPTRDSAPEYPISKPDLLKLARAVEDAMTRIIYRDDSQIVTEILGKRYAKDFFTEISISTKCSVEVSY